MAVASGKQVPGDYTAMLQSILTIGLIQDVKEITSKDNKSQKRDDLGLPSISKPTDQVKFQTVLTNLAIEKV